MTNSDTTNVETRNALSSEEVAPLLALKQQQPELFAFVVKEAAILNAKAHDYAGEDPYGNFRLCERQGLPAWKGVVVRLGDKLARIQQFAASGELRVANESVLDTFLDLANYANIGAALYSEAQRERLKQCLPPDYIQSLRDYEPPKPRSVKDQRAACVEALCRDVFANIDGLAQIGPTLSVAVASGGARAVITCNALMQIDAQGISDLLHKAHDIGGSFANEFFAVTITYPEHLQIDPLTEAVSALDDATEAWQDVRGEYFEAVDAGEWLTANSLRPALALKLRERVEAQARVNELAGSRAAKGGSE